MNAAGKKFTKTDIGAHRQQFSAVLEENEMVELNATAN
jgi:hypothetical protein